MADYSTLVTTQHAAYIAERTQKDDQFLLDLKAAAKDAGIPAIWINAAQASLMQILLKLNRAKDVVEVGTLAGYSAFVMARALPDDGLVRTIEIEPKHVEFTREWAAKSDVADKVRVDQGAGSDVLATYDDDSADAAFLDADKNNYPVYLDECLRIVRKGGLIMVDNAFAFGQLFDENPTDPEAEGVKRFNDYMASKSGIHSVIVATGDGLWVGVKE